MSLTDSIPWVCHFSYFMGEGGGLEDFFGGGGSPGCQGKWRREGKSLQQQSIKGGLLKIE